MRVGSTPFAAVGDVAEPIDRDVRSDGGACPVHATAAPAYSAGMEPLASVGAGGGTVGAD